MRRWQTRKIVLTAITGWLISGITACDGFFVDPLLTGLAVGPSATIQTGSTIQMSAIGSYNDGSQNKLSSKVFWNSATPSVASVASSGVVTRVGPGQSVIRASVEKVTGSATITVVVGNLTAIQGHISERVQQHHVWHGSTEQFVATGTANGQQIDLTNSVTCMSFSVHP